MVDVLTLNMAATGARFTSRLQGFAQRLVTDGGKAVEDQAQDTRQVVIAATPVGTGFLQAHWGPVTQQGDPFTWGFSNDTPYGPILEYGGYQRIGDKTVGLAGGDLGEGFVAGPGIYSRQAPLGFVRRALAQAAPALRTRLATVLRQAWNTRDMGGGWPGGVGLPAGVGPSSFTGRTTSVALTQQFVRQAFLTGQASKRARRRP